MKTRKTKWVTVLKTEQYLKYRPQEGEVMFVGVEMCRTEHSVLVWVPRFGKGDKQRYSYSMAFLGMPGLATVVEVTPDLVRPATANEISKLG